MTNRTIVFGSPEAKAVVEADRELRRKEEKEKLNLRWYIVSCEETNLTNWRVKATSKEDALNRCGSEGEQVDVVESVDFEPHTAHVDPEQDG